MTDQDSLRERIKTALDRFTGESWDNHHRDAAQAVIDEFELTVHGDDCGYHEIHGSYDTRFEEG